MINSDNSIQINIKFTFTVHEYIIAYEYIYEYILLPDLMNFVFFVYCNIVAIHTYDGHTSFTFTWPFAAGFINRNGLHNCEHDPTY